MRPITNVSDAEQALDELAEVLMALRGVLEQETVLVHAGKVRSAVALGPTKSELAGRLLAYGERLKQNAKFLLQEAPARCAAVQLLQESLRGVLQRNTVVLATAHAVSEGIVRRLAGDLARKAAPQVYGASGRAATPGSKHGQPLAVSRTL
jgi:hypothetical protein